jgi:hypothetical protein
VRRSIPAIVLAVAIVALTSTLAPRLAWAALDPQTAEADAHAVLTEYSFCTKPSFPLSVRARELCPIAGEVPGCTALVEACNDAKPPPPKPSAFFEALGRLIAAIGPYVAWVLIGLLVLGLLYLAVRAIRAARSDGVVADPAAAKTDVFTLPAAAVEESLTAAEALLRLANEARARGDLKMALVTYLAASLRALDDRGAIRIARDRTNGEYLRACQELAARPSLRELVREVDAVQFGGSVATPDTVSVAHDRAESIVRSPSPHLVPAASPALLAIGAVGALLLLGACNGPGSNSRNNPAGHDLLTDLLVKQGAKISSLPGSLASLPMKGKTGAVVILDAERVPLEDETRDHLVAWVRQGGTLVIAGSPSQWPPDFWARPTTTECASGPATVTVETRSPKVAAKDVQSDDEDEDDEPATPSVPSGTRHARIPQGAAMTWPSEDRAPLAIARLEDGELYGALRTFGEGRVLGLATGDLLTNLGLAVPGNASALVGMLATLGRNEFAVARSEQGIAPPSNPFSGLIHIGLGPALLHAALFIPLLFFAFGARQAAPRVDASLRRRSFAEHVQAVGALYARRRAATHALAIYAKHVDDRVRARMGRGTDPVQFLAARSGADLRVATELYARAREAKSGERPKGDELHVLKRLSELYAKAMERG